MKNGGPGCLFLFSLPFAGVGVLMFFMTLNVLNQWRRANTWQEVKAHLVSVDLHSHTSDDSTTYEVAASYNYQFGGSRYSGTRVGLTVGSDNIGDYHERVYDRLRKAMDEDQQVPCYVNPEDPTEAYLDLELRWGMLIFYMVFVFMFGGAGFGIMGFSGYQLFKKVVAIGLFKHLSSQSKSAPISKSKTTPKPALADDIKTIQGTASTKGLRLYQTAGAKKIVRHIVIAVVWNLFAIPITWFAWPKLADGDLLTSMLLIFPLIGSLLAIAAVLDAIHWRKFGLSNLSLKAPPKAGQRWSCVLTNNAVLRFDNGFKIQLKRPVKFRSDKEPDVLAETESYPQNSGRSGLYLPFSLMVPPSENLRWLLEVTADIPGLDYKAEFEIKGDTLP